MSENLSGTESVANAPEGQAEAATGEQSPTGATAPTGSRDPAVEAEATGGEGQSDAAVSGEQEPQEVWYELDGEEVSLETIKQWKSGHLMQSDYTKKTQALADERKTFAEQRQALDGKLNLLAEIEGELEKVVMGDLAGVDMDKLRSEDTSEYLRVKELREERAKTLSQLAEKRAKLQGELNSQNYQSLHNALGWDDESRRTDDLKAITAQAKREGVSEKDFATFLHPAIMKWALKAEKYDRLQDAKPEITKRVVKAPKAAKPSKGATTKSRTLAERMFPSM